MASAGVTKRGRKAGAGTGQAARTAINAVAILVVQPQIVRLLAEIDFVVVGGC